MLSSMAETADGAPLHHKLGVFSLPENDYLYEFDGTEDDWIRIQLAFMSVELSGEDDDI